MLSVVLAIVNSSPTMKDGSACGSVCELQRVAHFSWPSVALFGTYSPMNCKSLGPCGYITFRTGGRKRFRSSEAEVGGCWARCFCHWRALSLEGAAAKQTSWIMHHCPALFWGWALIYEHRLYCYWLQASQRHFINWEVCLFAYALFLWEFPCVWTEFIAKVKLQRTV